MTFDKRHFIIKAKNKDKLQTNLFISVFELMGLGIRGGEYGWLVSIGISRVKCLSKSFFFLDDYCVDNIGLHKEPSEPTRTPPSQSLKAS